MVPLETSELSGVRFFSQDWGAFDSIYGAGRAETMNDSHHRTGICGGRLGQAIKDWGVCGDGWDKESSQDLGMNDSIYGAGTGTTVFVGLGRVLQYLRARDGTEMTFMGGTGATDSIYETTVALQSYRLAWNESLYRGLRWNDSLIKD
jgi:hypothetical protein